MEKLTLETPILYGDHHVVEVRRLLLALPGVVEVYASSSFQAVEVTFEPERISETEITSKLEQAGYLGESIFPKESGLASYGNAGEQAYFRHTAVYETTRQGVSFAQDVNQSERPLWPCPGIGVLKAEE